MNEDVLTTLPTDARAQVDAYLDAVERALRDAGVERARRRGITDDIELHLRDALASTPGPYDAADVAALLARLDPPERYGDATRARPTADAGTAVPEGGGSGAAPTPPAGGRWRRRALARPRVRTGVAWLAVSLTCATVLCFGLFFVQQAGPGIRMDGPVEVMRALALVAVPLGVIGALAATVRGWSSLIAIGAGERGPTALPASLVAAVTWPTLVVWALAAVATLYVAAALPDAGNEGRRQLNRLIVAVVLGGLSTGGIAFAALRTARVRRRTATA